MEISERLKLSNYGFAGQKNKSVDITSISKMAGRLGFEPNPSCDLGSSKRSTGIKNGGRSGIRTHGEG